MYEEITDPLKVVVAKASQTQDELAQLLYTLRINSENEDKISLIESRIDWLQTVIVTGCETLMELVTERQVA